MFLKVTHSDDQHRCGPDIKQGPRVAADTLNSHLGRAGLQPCRMR